MNKYTMQKTDAQPHDDPVSIPGVKRVTPAPMPDPSEKVWVVIVAHVTEKWDEDDEGYKIYRPLWVLSPKGGGPASLLDKATWGDKSMAEMRAAMTRDRLAKDRRSYNQAATTGFVADGKLYWSDGVPADGERRGQ